MTRRGAVLAAVAALSWLAAFGLRWPAALLPAVLASVLLAVAAGLVLAPSSLTVERRLTNDRVARGQAALLRVDVRNEGRWRTPPGHLTETVRDRLVRTRLRSLPAGGSLRTHAAVPGLPRGRHALPGMGVERSDPLDLLRRHGRLTGASALWVHPVPTPLPTAASRSLPHSAPLGTGRLLGDEEMLALRDYQPGDDPRTVHWRATAHSGHLMVIERSGAARGRTVVLLDPRSRGPEPDLAFETATDLAAGALAAAREAGHLVELAVPGLPLAQARREGARDDLDHLSLVRAQDDRDRMGARQVLTGTGGAGTLVVVSAAGDVDLVRTAARRRTGRTVVVLVDPPEPGAATPGARGRPAGGSRTALVGNVQVLRVLAGGAT
jgi:uncharacterized protein (DUF58 family)